MAEEKKTKKYTAGGMTVVSVSEKGFRRGGVAFTRTPTYVEFANLDDEQIEAIRNEPQLIVVDGKKAEPKKMALPDDVADADPVPYVPPVEAAPNYGHGNNETATRKMLEDAKDGKFTPHPSFGSSISYEGKKAPVEVEVEPTIKAASKEGDKAVTDKGGKR